MPTAARTRQSSDRVPTGKPPMIVEGGDLVSLAVDLPPALYHGALFHLEEDPLEGLVDYDAHNFEIDVVAFCVFQEPDGRRIVLAREPFGDDYELIDAAAFARISADQYRAAKR